MTTFEIKGEHWTVKSVKLNAFTDNNDTLIETETHHLFKKSLFHPMYGDIFFLENHENENAIVIITENADCDNSELNIYKGVVEITGETDVQIHHCTIKQSESVCRKILKDDQSSKSLMAMSNTWGDKNGSTRVCREFVLKEIDCAQQLGIDIVQIDDGWQMGDTAWKSERDELKRRTFKDGYWDINYQRFPNGLKEISEYANEKNIRMGLWFAPSSHNCYAHFSRDVEVLKKAYTDWGFNFFKLDMYFVTNNQEKEKILGMLKTIYKLGDDVAVQMDITRFSRLNYLCGRQFGTIFAENRYTASANSFPHRVLRNLWTLSRFIPTSRFQFEIVNPDLNCEAYDKNDPFAPTNYDMDYLFATVMFCNPLFWMELQHLSDKRKNELKNIINIWKSYREELSKCDIRPIGQKPDGRSFTGFCASLNGKDKYLLLFREVTSNSKCVLISDVNSKKTNLIASNSNCEINLSNGIISLNMEQQRSYAFIELID